MFCLSMCKCLLYVVLVQVVANGTEDEAGEQTNMPENHEKPEWIIHGGAFGPICQIRVHRAEERLREAGALRQGDVRR